MSIVNYQIRKKEFYSNLNKEDITLLRLMAGWEYSVEYTYTICTVQK